MDQDKQIREMTKDLQKCEHWYYDEIACTAELDEHKTATNLYNEGYRKQSKWISVEEKLPTSGELVLVSSMDLLTKKHEWFYLASYDNERKWWNGASFGRVTHWMPLPEPPKMKGGAG